LAISDVVKYRVGGSIHSPNIICAALVTRLCGPTEYRGLLTLTATRLDFHSELKFFSLQIPWEMEVAYLENCHSTQPAIGIDTVTFHSFLLVFELASEQQDFIKNIATLGVRTTHGIDTSALRKAQDQWMDGTLSNLGYLRILNRLSGRSCCDAAHYPIVPRTLRDVSGRELPLTNPGSFRDFSLPVYAQTVQQRSACSMTYAQPNGHTPTFVSSFNTTIGHLARLEPFAKAAAQQGHAQLVLPEDAIPSGSASSSELPPEAYFLPEMFASDLNFPAWARKPHHFVWGMLDALESDHVSQRLHEWIDLIWGIRQSGQPARDRFNVFPPPASGGDRSGVDMKQCGEIPVQLFDKAHPKRRVVRGDGRLRIASRRVMPASFDPSWQMLTQEARVRNQGGNLETSSSNAPSSLVVFTDALKPVHLVASESEFATSHILPVVNHWKATAQGIKHVALLRGHIAEIRSLLLQCSSAILAAGHCDGVVSIFSIYPHQFIRILRTDIPSPIAAQVSTNRGILRADPPLPVTGLALVPARSDLIVLQRLPGGGECKTRISLWSVNGILYKSRDLKVNVKQSVVTSFEEGTKENVIILMTDTYRLITLDTRALEVRQELTFHPSMSDGILSIEQLNEQSDQLCLKTAHQVATFSIGPVAEISFEGPARAARLWTFLRNRD
jgi:hypothetical protein